MENTSNTSDSYFTEKKKLNENKTEKNNNKKHVDYEKWMSYD